MKLTYKLHFSEFWDIYSCESISKLIYKYVYTVEDPISITQLFPHSLFQTLGPLNFVSFFVVFYF